MGIELLFDTVPSHWQYMTLGQACTDGGGDIQTGPFGSQLHASDYVEHGVPSIMPYNIGDNRVIEDGIARITLQDAKRLERYRVREGDIVYSRRGDVERRALIRENEDGWLCGTGCLRIRFGNKSSGVNSKFASYYLGHPNVREWILRHAHGATMPNLNTSILSALPFAIPPLSEQRAIAHILGTLDDKIEINRRINETLESMARTLYTEWFLNYGPIRAKTQGRNTGLHHRFDAIFPSDLISSELGEIPAGWRVMTIGDVASRIGMGPFGSSIKVETFVTQGMPIISGQHLRRQILEDNTFKFISHEHAERLNNAIVTRGDIIFTHAGNISNLAFIPENSRYENYIISQRQFFMRCNPLYVNPFFIVNFFKSPIGEHKLLANSSSVGVPSIAQPVTYLRSIKLVIPNKQVMDAFESLVHPVYMRIRHTMNLISTLSGLRDVLLAKLVSGELRVRDWETEMLRQRTPSEEASAQAYRRHLRPNDRYRRG